MSLMTVQKKRRPSLMPPPRRNGPPAIPAGEVAAGESPALPAAPRSTAILKAGASTRRAADVAAEPETLIPGPIPGILSP